VAEPTVSERVSPDELVRRLERLLPAGAPAALVFDGDGTLWSGDVAEDVFLYAVNGDLLKDELAEPLGAAARAHGLELSGSASAIAGELFQAYLDGRFPELAVCEVMTWCFAGRTLAELGEMTDRALAAAKLDERVHRGLEPVFDFSRRRGVRVLVVSASPRFIVERAAERWQIAPSDIAASTPELAGGRVQPRLAGPVPYGEAKVEAGRRLLGSASWLASFGDSPFDLAMMRAAQLGVAVEPKPSLSARLDEVPGAVVLAL
jgi:phosphatidylglycerophosphatase C